MFSLQGKFHEQVELYIRYIENNAIRRIINVGKVNLPWAYDPTVYDEFHPFAEYIIFIGGCSYIIRNDENGISKFKGDYNVNEISAEIGNFILPDVQKPTPTPTPVATSTPTPTPVTTASPTPTPVATSTPTPTPVATATPTPTPVSNIELITSDVLDQITPTPNKNRTSKRLQWIEGQLYEYDVTISNGQYIQIEIIDPTPQILTNQTDINNFINKTRGWINNSVYENLLPNSGAYVENTVNLTQEVAYNYPDSSLLPFTFFNRIWVDNLDNDFNGIVGIGSGTIVTPYIYLTNEHVLTDNDNTPSVPNYDQSNEFDIYINVGDGAFFGSYNTTVFEKEIDIITTQDDKYDMSVVLFQPSSSSSSKFVGAVNQTYLPIEFDGITGREVLHVSGYPGAFDENDPRFADPLALPRNDIQRKITFIPNILSNGMYFTNGRGNGLESGASGSPTFKKDMGDLLIVGLFSKSTVTATASNINQTSFGGVRFTESLHYSWLKSWMSSRGIINSPV